MLGGKRIRTILLRDSSPHPACDLVDNDVPHAVFSPLAQERDDFLSGAGFGDLEAQDLGRGFDVQEPQQPVLVLGLDGPRC